MDSKNLSHVGVSDRPSEYKWRIKGCSKWIRSLSLSFFVLTMVRLSLIALSAATISAVSAHFQLTYPQTRGFNEDNEPQAPCGGFNNVGSRSEFPLENGFVQINSGHTSYKYTVKVITSSNPSTSDFTGSNATVIGSGSRNYPGDACLTVSTNNGTDIKAGTNATIQITYDGGDGSLYQVRNKKSFDHSFANQPVF